MWHTLMDGSESASRRLWLPWHKYGRLTKIPLGWHGYATNFKETKTRVFELEVHVNTWKENNNNKIEDKQAFQCEVGITHDMIYHKEFWLWFAIRSIWTWQKFLSKVGRDL